MSLVKLLIEWGHSEKEAINAAIKDIYELGRVNPINSREVVIDNNVFVEVRNFDGHLWISSIMTLDRGRGDARRVLKQICDIADKHQVYTALSPSPYGTSKGLNKKELIAWYKRYGFKKVDTTAMERAPNPPTSSATVLQKEDEYYIEDAVEYRVRGYIKPESAFHTIAEWENISREFLSLQKQGYDVRGGQIGKNERLIELVNKYFSYQLYTETELFDKYTKKMVLDFIEDFVNHRVWTLREEYDKYLVNIENDKIAFFYSRGNIEPYVLLDETFTVDTYGTTNIEVVAYHWTSKEGLKNIATSLQAQNTFSISCFTAQFKNFFRPESNVLVKFKGQLVAAFQSDVKSFATDRGHRAANLFRFSFPEHEENLCRDWAVCKKDVTHLWNEIILMPTAVLSYKIYSTIETLSESVHDPVRPGIVKQRLGSLNCTKVKAAKSKLKDKGTHYAKALQRYLNYHCND